MTCNQNTVMSEPNKAAEVKTESKDKKRKKLFRKRQKLVKKLKISVPIPEGLRKSWEREKKMKLRRKLRKVKKLKLLPEKRNKQAERIKNYEKEYHDLKESEAKDSLKARSEGNFYKPADAKVMVVIRIRGINRISPKVKKVLQLFRLLQIHNAVFVKVNKATMNMLQLIQPYVAFGYPTVSTIRSLLYKRGFAKIRHRPGAISRVPIMSNEFIERHLRRHGVETIEDIAHEIYTVGSHFKEVSNFLWPFKLNCPRGGYRGRKRRHFNEGGSYGNWEHHINKMVERML